MFTFLFSFLFVGGCTSSKESASSTDSSHDSHEADSDTDADSDADSDSDSDADSDLSVTTQGGLYTLSYLPTPNPPVSGDTALWMKLEDTIETGIVGATLTLTPWMPDMGHGIMTPPVVSELGNGEYNATWAYSMGGTWEVTVDIVAGLGNDSAVLTFDVQ